MRHGAVIAGYLAVLATGCAGAGRRDGPLADATPAQLAHRQQISQAAQEAFDAQDWPRARSALERLVVDEPFSSDALQRLGRVIQAQGALSEAESTFRKALVLDRDNVDALIGLANVEAQLGRFENALTHLNTAIEIEPRRAEAHLAEGRTLESLGRTNQALGAYFRAMEFDPNLSPAQLRIAALQLDEGRFDQVLVRLDQLLEQTPDDPESRFQRGRAHLALKHYPQAIEDLRFAATHLPRRAEVFYQLALAYDASRESAAALQAAEQAHKLSPSWADARDLSLKLSR